MAVNYHHSTKCTQCHRLCKGVRETTAFSQPALQRREMDHLIQCIDNKKRGTINGLFCHSTHFVKGSQGDSSSLVPRPEEEEKEPGFSRSCMRLIISDLTTC